MTSLRADAESLARLITATSSNHGPAIRAFHQKLDRALLRETLDEAAAVFFNHATPECPIDREVILYVMSGTLVECGADPGIGWDHLQSRLHRCFMVLARDADQLAKAGVDLDAGGSREELEPELRGWVSGFRNLVVAVMARLSRRRELRQQARLGKDLLEAVSEVEQKLPSSHVYFLHEVLKVLDDRILLVDVITQEMKVLEVQAIRNCAHLMALLDGADARRIGSAPGATWEVTHHYASFGCLDEETVGFFRRQQRLKDADWIFMLGVEMSGWNIPVFDVPGLGPMRIVVRGPKRWGSRSFEASGFFAPIHDELVETVVLERSLPMEHHTRVAASLVDAARHLRQVLGRTNGAAPFSPGQLEHPAWVSHWNPMPMPWDQR